MAEVSRCPACQTAAEMARLRAEVAEQRETIRHLHELLRLTGVSQGDVEYQREQTEACGENVLAL